MSAESSLQNMELDAKLDKIRTQITSKLENQQQLALVLQAIDETLDGQQQKKGPVTYFVSFLSLLDQCCVGEELKDFDLATKAVYFLDLVSPFAPKQLLKAKFSEILARLAPALSSSDVEAPLSKSSIGVLETLLLVQETSAWINSNNYKISPKRGLTGLLELSLDPRPKVRKRAQEAVNKVLSNVPAGPSLEHPGAALCGEFSLNSIINLLQQQQQQQGKGKNSNAKQLNSEIIHNLQLISAITNANSWPLKQILPLCDVLLAVSKTTDQFLVSSAFEAFEGLFQSMNDQIDEDKFAQVLNVLFDLKPALNDQHLAPSWLAVIAKAITSFARNVDPFKCFLRVPDVFKVVAEYFASEVENVRISASQCLIAIVVDAVDEKLLLLPPAISNEVYESVDEVISSLAEITGELLSVKHRSSAKEVCELIATLFTKLRSRCNPDFIPHLEVIGEWRSNEKEGFELNEVSENVISLAISAIGPEAVLHSLPLNLNQPQETGRAWLLPILRDNVRNAQLGFYIREILPLVDFFEEKIASGNPGSVNSKVFATIIDQIWSLLPHFCDLCSDLMESFTDDFASKLATLLYEKVSLRNTICHALRLLVESNLTYSMGVIEDAVMLQQFPIELAKKNLEYLSSTKASKLLSVLFNVFSQTPMEQRGFVLETIDAFLKISDSESLCATFDKVCSILKQALDEEKESDLIKNDDPVSKTNIPKLSITMLDLIVLMAKYVPASCHNALFTIFNQTVVIQDVQLQKRSYRILTKLIETETGLASVLNFISNIVEIIMKTAETTLTAAKATRLSFILALVKALPADQLHFIPAVISEVIISTKSQNEKTRESAYQILVAMGYKFVENDGVVIKNSLNDPDMPDSVASLQECFTMCSAGLVGATPNMVSAAITSLSCLIYEFHSQMDAQLLLDIYSTVELFLTSKNREIINSTLGFLKVSILSLPEDMTAQNMKGLLTNLMACSHEHKNHFKSKIKHIIERLLRKFGIDLIEESIPEEDKKLIANIKKSKARAKRKKTEEKANGTNTETGNNSSRMSGYDAAIHDDSESEEEEEERTFDKSKGRNQSRQYISESRSAPLDLLDKQTLAHISSSKPKRFNKKSVEDSKFETKNGKLVFREDGDDDSELLGKNSIDAYVEAVKQGPIRGQKNKLRYKKKGGDDIDWEDEPDGDEAPRKPRGPGGPNRGGFGRKNDRFSRVNKSQQKFRPKRKF